MALAIGDRIAERRAALGLSRAKLGRMSALEAMAIYRWETGRATPSLVSARALARALGVTLDWLVDGRDQRSRTHRGPDEEASADE